MAISPTNPAGAAAPKSNAIVKFGVVCPMCTASSTQYRLNPRLFWSEGQDIDLQPRQYKCMAGLEGLHPPLYFIWHCPKCKFAWDNKTFSDPVKDMNIGLDLIRPCIRNAYEKDKTYRATADLLDANVKPEALDYFGAVKLHLMAVLVLKQMEPVLKQFFILPARCYLHLAWLYRDIAELPAGAGEIEARMKLLALDLLPLWADAPMNERAALQKAVAYYNLALEDTRSVRNPVDEVNVMQLIARIYAKMGEPRQAQELLMESVQKARTASTDIKQKLHASGREGRTLSSSESGALVTLDRRLESLLEDADRLMDKIREMK